jgi:hypothetical protein
MKMRKRTSAVVSGLGIIAVLVALTPDPVAAARGGARGAGVRGHGFAARGVVATGGVRRAAVVRPGWRAGVRPGWAGRRVAAGVAVGRPGWNGGWGGGWGWPVATGVAVGVAATSPWGWGGNNCTRWNGFRWVNVCGSYGWGW